MMKIVKCYIILRKCVCLIVFIILSGSLTEDIANEDSNFMINTVGCKIPNVNITFHDKEPKIPYHLKRHIYLRKVSDGTKLQFIMTKAYHTCCYSFIIYKTLVGLDEDKDIRYAPCLAFNNMTVIKIKEEFIRVICKRPIYEDFYAFVKQREVEEHASNNSWNVILIGMGSMSRMHAYNALNETMRFMKKNQWLDFRGFNKVGISSTPNLVSLLSGFRGDFLYNDKCTDVSHCSDRMIWKAFERAGYVTAFGEDNNFLLPTFRSYYILKNIPTHHYLRPLFLAGEKLNLYKHIIYTCGKIFSGQQVLDYIADYMKTYVNKKYFGFFFLSTFTHCLSLYPQKFDKPLVAFLKKLKAYKLMENTILLLFSDHGIRYDSTRYQSNSYYEERLPLLFLKVPKSFKKLHPEKYDNLLLNQHRLITTYDLHLTLLDILHINNTNENNTNLEECDKCNSIFKVLPENRTCADVGIISIWCSCVTLVEADLSNNESMITIGRAASYLRNIAKNTHTKPCTRCMEIIPEKVLTSNYFFHNNIKYFVTTILDQDRSVYEIIIQRIPDNGKWFYGVIHVQKLSAGNINSKCYTRNGYKDTCKCVKDVKCNEKTLRIG